MTETKEGDALPAAIEAFVLRWGDMGGQWGVNRSVAQIHALLYVSEAPLPAEAIASALGMARSNVSNSLKELLGWRLIERVPVRGDRRDHYAAEADLWEMVRRIAAGRKAREIDPAARALAECLVEAREDPDVDPAALARLEELHDFVARVGRWHDQMLALPVGKVMALIDLGDRLGGLLGGRGGDAAGDARGKGRSRAKRD